MTEEERDISEILDRIFNLFVENQDNLEEIKGLLLSNSTRIAEMVVTRSIRDAAREAALLSGEDTAEQADRGESTSDALHRTEYGRGKSASAKVSVDSGEMLYCSFCGKSQNEVKKLIAGPSVFICDECIVLCMDVIREESDD